MKRLAVSLLLALALAACSEPVEVVPAADSVPSLAQRLATVDQLLVDAQWEAARAEVGAVIADANTARTAGDLEPAAADRIVASAQRLLAALPEPPPVPTPTVTVSVAPPANEGGKGDDKRKKDEKDDD